MNGSVRRPLRHRPRLARPLRTLHRWLGLAAAVFLLLLCATGVALNHSTGLGLDSRFVGQSWLLDWYGIRGPSFGPSYPVAGRWITLAGERVYLDATEVGDAGLDTIVGAAAIGDEIAVAGPAELVMLNAAGEIVDRVPTAVSLPARLEAVGALPGALALRSDGRVFLYNPATAAIRGADETESAWVWTEAASLPASLREEIDFAFRGRGLSLERVLTDLHSGRLVGLSGVVFNDLTAVALFVLALTGLVLFFRR
jgi:hypothetical protein